MTVATILSIALIHLAAAMSPGPSFVVAARTAVSEGFGTAVALAIGFGLGAVLWAAAAMAGLALFFELVPQLFLALKQNRVDRSDALQRLCQIAIVKQPAKTKQRQHVRW